jgi:hypothetical protein
LQDFNQDWVVSQQYLAQQIANGEIAQLTQQEKNSLATLKIQLSNIIQLCEAIVKNSKKITTTFITDIKQYAGTNELVLAAIDECEQLALAGKNPNRCNIANNTSVIEAEFKKSSELLNSLKHFTHEKKRHIAEWVENNVFLTHSYAEKIKDIGSSVHSKKIENIFFTDIDQFFQKNANKIFSANEQRSTSIKEAVSFLPLRHAAIVRTQDASEKSNLIDNLQNHIKQWQEEIIANAKQQEEKLDSIKLGTGIFLNSITREDCIAFFKEQCKERIKNDFVRDNEKNYNTTMEHVEQFDRLVQDFLRNDTDVNIQEIQIIFLQKSKEDNTLFSQLSAAQQESSLHAVLAQVDNILQNSSEEDKDRIQERVKNELAKSAGKFSSAVDYSKIKEKINSEKNKLLEDLNTQQQQLNTLKTQLEIPLKISLLNKLQCQDDAANIALEKLDMKLAEAWQTIVTNFNGTAEQFQAKYNLTPVEHVVLLTASFKQYQASLQKNMCAKGQEKCRIIEKWISRLENNNNENLTASQKLAALHTEINQDKEPLMVTRDSAFVRYVLKPFALLGLTLFKGYGIAKKQVYGVKGEQIAHTATFFTSPFEDKRIQKNTINALYLSI